MRICYKACAPLSWIAHYYGQCKQIQHSTSSWLKGGTFPTWGLIMEFFSYLSFTSLVLEEYKASNSNPAHMGHNLTSKFMGLLIGLGPMTILTYSLSDGSTLIQLLTTVSYLCEIHE